MTSKSDASKNILGFKYQEMVALIECFEAKDNSKIYLECLGDISDGNTSTEVKHSSDDEKKLIDTHIDFWKTLSNIIDGYDIFRFYDKFILHTTAKIKERSIFETWGELSKKERVDKIILVESNNTINPYYNNVIKFDRLTLEEILGKLVIKDNQKTAKEYYKTILIQHPAVINVISEKDREPFICSLLGYLSMQLINATDYIWEIDISSFRENFQAYAKQYQLGDLKFPVSQAVSDPTTQNNYQFVKQLLNIGYERKVGRSMENYLKASESQIRMIQARQSLVENLENYDKDIKDVVNELKDKHEDQIRVGDNLKEKAKRFFDDSIEQVSNKTKIEGVTLTRSYYPKGRLLHNVEINSINLNLNPEDEG